MLQVLCQILQTDSLVDVQSWLVSASNQEKERVKHLIDNAMKGLEESGRIETLGAGENSSFQEQQQQQNNRSSRHQRRTASEAAAQQIQQQQQQQQSECDTSYINDIENALKKY